MRRSGGKPHPCRVNFLGCKNRTSRLGRLVQHFVETSIVQTSFVFLSLLIPILLVASPQQTGENSARPVAAVEEAEKLQTPAANFPQIPYQGVPPELAQDQGTAGLRLALRRLGTTARLMQTVAHPDDEDGGMLTLEARGRGVSTLLMTLNRGEGGQNKIGSNLSDVLGVLRAEELLASDQYYGVQERFSRVADFGFSKSA